MLITFDAGIYISAFRFNGVPEEALKQCLVYDTILTCDHLESEVVRVMGVKFAYEAMDTRQRLEEFLQNAKRVVVPQRLHGICRDPDDDYLLECALLGHSPLIVTGDKDLLTIGSFRDIQIQTPRQYLDSLKLRIASQSHL